MIRWEIWVSDEVDDIAERIGWRFNACFDDRAKAAKESEWYAMRGYAVDIRMRTTRYQQHRHVTTG